MPVALSNLLFHCVIFLIIITLWVSVEHIIEIQFFTLPPNWSQFFIQYTGFPLYL